MSTALAVLPQYDPALKDSDGLTHRQRAFADHYITLNSAPQPLQRSGFGAEACRRAGYQGPVETLSVQAWSNLKLPKVREYIRRKLSLVAMPADEVLQRLSKQARGDMSQVLNADGIFDFKSAKKRGNTDLIRKLKTRKTRRIDPSTDEVVEEVTHELELHNSQSALEIMAKHHGLLVERTSSINVDLTLNANDLSDLVLAALESSGLLPGAIDVTPARVSVVESANGSPASNSESQ